MERAKEVMGKEFTVKLYHLLLAASLQIAAGAWWTSKLDSRVEINTRSIARESGVNVVQAEQLKIIEASRFKDTDGARLSELTVANRERISVVESDMRHIKEAILSLRDGQKDMLDILRKQ